MTTDRNTIFYRYWNALIEDDDGRITLEPGAVRLALRLAIDDAYGAGPDLASDLSAIVANQDKALQAALDRVDKLRQERNDQPDQRSLEVARTQIGRLNDWLQVHEPGLYISPGDTADATLAALGKRDKRIATLQTELDNAIGERTVAEDANRRLHYWLTANISNDYPDALDDADLAIWAITALQQTVTAMQQAGTNGATPTTNGAALDPTPAAQSEVSDWGRNHPAWQALPAADLAVIDQLSSGQIKFRSLSRTLRRDLVHRVIRSLAANNGGKLTSSAWDRYRPLWLPTQAAVCVLSPTGNWPSLLAAALNHSPLPQPEEAN